MRTRRSRGEGGWLGGWLDLSAWVCCLKILERFARRAPTNQARNFIYESGKGKIKYEVLYTMMFTRALSAFLHEVLRHKLCPKLNLEAPRRD